MLTTFTVLADIAQNVAGDKLQVESITKVGAEIHGYEPTPGDIRKAADADLILDNGLNLEAWFAQFVEDVDVPHVVVSEGVEPIAISEDAYAGQAEPARLDVAAQRADLRGQHGRRVQRARPARTRPTYAANGEAYKAQAADRCRTSWSPGSAALPPNQRALVTCEGAFSYLARDAGLTEKYIWPVNAEQQATPQQIASRHRVREGQPGPGGVLRVHGVGRADAAGRRGHRRGVRRGRSTSTRCPRPTGPCRPTST